MPEPPPEPEPGPKIGVDSWVAVAGRPHAARTARQRGSSLGVHARLGQAARLRGACREPSPYRLLTSEGDLFNFGLFTLLFVGLGLGLNVVVGWAGLLDLGYVAFYGIGAYAYALLSSSYYGIHWPAEAAIPLAMLAAAIPAAILGFSARRLLGDYLAIVTLFFAEAFLVFTNVADPTFFGKGLTGGANGIPELDPLTFFGHKLTTTKELYFFLVGAVAVVAALLYLANQSRTGRAWRASREDPLAAEVMSIPVNRLKILAFIFSSAIAGLFGAIYAAITTAAVSTNFGIGVLIIIYAVIILGGLGSIAGVFVGAIIINCTFVFLEPQTDHPGFKRWLFYGTIILLIALMKPWYKALIVFRGDDRDRLHRPCRGRGVGRVGLDVRQDGLRGGLALRTGSSSRKVKPRRASTTSSTSGAGGCDRWSVISLKGWWRIIALGPDALSHGRRVGERAEREPGGLRP